MALQFNEQEEVQLGSSRIGVRDVYVQPAVDPNAGSGMISLAKSLEGLSGAYSEIQKKSEADDVNKAKPWAITAFSELGGKATPDAINNVLSPYRGAQLTNRADALGLLTGRTEAEQWQKNMTPADLETPEATEAFWARGLVETQKKYPNAHHAFTGGFTESFYSTGRGYAGKNDEIRTGEQLKLNKDAVIDGVTTASPGTYVPSRAANPQQATTILATARRLNVDPRFLTTFLLFESGGKMTPDAPTGVPGSDRYGLLQVKPGSEEERKYGFSPTQTFDEQMLSVEAYLKDRKFVGTGTADDFVNLYSTINAGKPGMPDFVDGGGRSVRTNADLAKSQWGKKAEEFLGIIDAEPGNVTPGKGGSIQFDKPFQEAGVNPVVVDRAKQASALFGKNLVINSGHRDATYNSKVKGAKGSAHITGDAIDVSTKGMTDAEKTQLVISLRKAGFTRLIGYTGNDSIHADISTANGPFWPMWNKSNKNMGSAEQWFVDGVNADAAVQYASADSGTMTDALPEGTVVPSAEGMPTAPTAETPADPFSVSWEARVTAHAFNDRDAVAGSTAYWTRGAVRDAGVQGAITKATNMVLDGKSPEAAEEILMNTVPAALLTEDNRADITKARLAIRTIAEDNARKAAQKAQAEQEGRDIEFFQTYSENVRKAGDTSLAPEERAAAAASIDPAKAAIDPATGQFSMTRFDAAQKLMNQDNVTAVASKQNMYDIENKFFEAALMNDNFREYVETSGDAKLIEKYNNDQKISMRDIERSIWERPDLLVSEKTSLSQNLQGLLDTSLLTKSADEDFKDRVGDTLKALTTPGTGIGAALNDPTLYDRAYKAYRKRLFEGYRELRKQGIPIEFGEEARGVIDSAIEAGNAVAMSRQQALKNLNDDIKNGDGAAALNPLTTTPNRKELLGVNPDGSPIWKQ